ncbi:MAG TPA: MFS transporter, partial [Casimicrobiaceae bacterium]
TYGRRKTYALGVAGIAILAYPAFWLMNTREVPLVILAIVVPFGVVYPMVYGPIAAMFAESFSTRVRYTGVSFVYQFSGIFASGLTPLIAATLLHYGDNQPWLIAGYIVLVSIVSLISVAFLGDRTGKDLAEIDRMGAGPPVVGAGAVRTPA